MLRIIKKLFVGIFSALGFLTFIFLGLIAFSFFILGDGRAPSVSISDKIILTVNLDRGFAEGPSGRRFDGLSLKSQTTLQDAVIAIRHAADDPRVVALKANLSQQKLGLAQIQDIRDAVAEFRAAGKPTLLFSETIGEGIDALPTYYLASAFKDIWVQPSGTVGVAGIGTEQPFLKDFLARFGLKGSFLQRKEYKSAGEMYTNTEMSPANREATEALLHAWFDQIVTGIAETRSISPDSVASLIDRGPLLSGEALEGGLIDYIGYRDEFETAAHADLGDAAPLNIGRYLSLKPGDDESEPQKQIALIHAIGEITRGGGNEGSLFANPGVQSAPMSKAIRDAAEDDDVDALLIRIDSPGGSYVASDIIWREIKNAKSKSKPVIVSMGNAAASGGYFIAMPADRIFAQPATVTGSIGVVLGKLVFGDAAEKLGVNFDRISFGDSAGMFSSVTDFNKEDLARLNQMLDATYADFTSKAAGDRGMSIEDIDKVARGRVWSGTGALEVGLVDELGGLGKAIDYTKTQIGLAKDDPVWLVPFPEPEDPFRAFLRALENGELSFGIMSLIQTAVWMNETLAPAFGEVSALQRSGLQLYMPPVVVN